MNIINKKKETLSLFFKNVVCVKKLPDKYKITLGNFL